MIKELINNTDFDNKLPEILEYFNDIHNQIGKFNPRCGSYLFDGINYAYRDDFKHKQILLYEAAKKANHVLEIGVYMGHSLSIMLAANNKLKATVIDTDTFFLENSVELLRKKYPESEIISYGMDSVDVLINKFTTEKFDLFHIDGKHSIDHVSLEFEKIQPYIDGNTLKVVFDDIEISGDSFESLFNNFNIVDKYINDYPSPNGYYEAIKL